MRSPGPQDYATVKTSVFRRRNSVIPSMTFTTARREVAEALSKERPKSPGPHTYHFNRTDLLKRNPSATFGTTIRAVAVPVKE